MHIYEFETICLHIKFYKLCFNQVNCLVLSGLAGVLLLNSSLGAMHALQSILVLSKLFFLFLL